jgi:hypothetical protein
MVTYTDPLAKQWIMDSAEEFREGTIDGASRPAGRLFRGPRINLTNKVLSIIIEAQRGRDVAIT